MHGRISARALAHRCCLRWARPTTTSATRRQAAGYFREGNRVVAGTVDWSRKNFRRMVAARLDAKPTADRVAPSADFVPVFIVGMPRSGTTLVAELLSRHADVRYRGELMWMPFLAQQLGQVARPSAKMLEDAAATYRTQVRQDDVPARFYIDKQPLNFLHVDLIAALFPNARIIHCERNERDTALSIWMQYFAGPEQNFAYDFADIAAVMQGCDKLMAHGEEEGRREHPHDPLRTSRDRCGKLHARARRRGSASAIRSPRPRRARRQRSAHRASGRCASRSTRARSDAGAPTLPYVPELESFPAGDS